METLLNSFNFAYQREDGLGIAAVFTPIATEDAPDKLEAFHRSTNSVAIQNDLRSVFLYHNQLDMQEKEAQAWIDLFSDYWAAVGDLLQATHSQTEDVEWTRIYQSWRKVTETIIQGHKNAILPFWTVPLITVAGKYLRILAIKADEAARQKTGNVTYNEGLQDDIISSVGKNDNLQDAARQINRMFSACSQDRSPVEESRKWGLYAVANLLFKTYFSVRLTLCLSSFNMLTKASSMP
jgi:hypothetical protein